MVKVYDYYLHFLQSFTFATVCSLCKQSLVTILYQYMPELCMVSRLRCESSLTPAG